MALLDFQTGLGRLVLAPDGRDPLRSLQLDVGERASLQTLAQSSGYHFTVGVQRSWCVDRAVRAANLTLSALPPEVSSGLLDEWVNSGGGTSSFFAAEGEALLEFVASHLPDPSHELSLCQLEQATLRANEGARRFRPPDAALLDNPKCRLRRGDWAGIVRFHGEPNQTLNALLEHRSLPPVSPQPEWTMLFGPGIDKLCRQASPSELALWERLTAPVEVATLMHEGHRRDDITGLFSAGVIESAA
jgi:hypothetical protein